MRERALDRWTRGVGIRDRPSAYQPKLFASIAKSGAGSSVARHDRGPRPPDPDEEPTLTPEARARRTSVIGLWILGIFAAVYLLGFLVAIPVSAIAYLRFAAREGWVTSAAVRCL